MTILNQNKSVSEDYTFLVTFNDIFYTYAELPSAFYDYENSWSTHSGSSTSVINSYNAILDDIQNSLVNFEYQFTLIDMEQDFSNFLEENENGFYIGTSRINQSQQGYPNDTTNIGHPFILIKTSENNNDMATYIPIKILPLCNMKIVDTDYIIGENEYVSALYAKTLITKGIEDLKIFEILNAGSTDTSTYVSNNVSNPKSNMIYFVKKDNDSSDGLNITFDLYSYNSDGWIQLDNLALDLSNVAPKNHASSATTYGVGSSSNYGHVKVADNLTTSSFSSSAPVVLSAKQGKVLNDNKLEKTHASYKGKNVVTNASTGTIEFEEKNNHTHSNYLTSSDISGKIDTAGTGLSKNGTTLNHSNSVTALSTASLKKVKYDGTGHITGTSDVTASDLPSHTHDQYLTSHQTIKTINNQSLLGSGNLTVVTDISGKQDLLVSGTNIKTINNQSLLGSGNIQVSANADMSNYYTKTEIDTMIGDIQDYIYS